MHDLVKADGQLSIVVEAAVWAAFLIHKAPCVIDNPSVGGNRTFFNEATVLKRKLKDVVCDGTEATIVCDQNDVRQKVKPLFADLDCRWGDIAPHYRRQPVL